MVFWATLSRTWAAASPFVTGIRRQHVMAKFNVVFVLGGPGAGKGTQCANIVEKYGYAHLSAGDLLRAERQRPGELGEMIEHHIRNGTIVPVEVTCKLLEQAMKTSHKQNFLIDGFPRNEDNMNGWNREMHDKVNLKFVLFFDCPEEVCVQRCLHRGESGSGRSDDNLDSLKKRIATYNGASMPIIKHYDSHGLVRKVDCAKPVEEVWKDVQKLDF